MNPFKHYKSFDEICVLFLKERRITDKPGTLKGIKTHMKILGDWLAKNYLEAIPLRKIDKGDFAMFSQYLADKKGGRGLDQSTCEKYRLSISSLYGYAKKIGEVDNIPLELFVLPPKGKDCSAELIPEDKIAPLLADIEKNDYQLFIALMVVWGCYLRPRRELRLIKVKQFNLNEGTIRVVSEDAKVGKTRVVTIPSWLIEILKEYGIEKADQDMYVIGKNHTFDTIPVSENMLSYRFNQFRDAHGLSKGIQVYSCKHVGAREYLKVGDIVGLMRQLGHSDLSSTQHYVVKTLGIVDLNYQKNGIDPRTISRAS